MCKDFFFPQVGETINKYFLESLLPNMSKTTRIYVAFSNDLNMEVVIKVIKLNDDDNHYADTEANILKEVKSPFVLNAIEIFDICYQSKESSEQNKLRFLVTPKIGDDDALSFSGKYDYVKYIIYDTLHALQYLHGLNIIHRDVKPENIFVDFIDSKNNHLNFSDDESFFTKSDDFIGDRKIHAVLGDLGFAKQYPMDQGMNDSEEFVGTIQYCSPQVAVQIPYNESTDIWSLGATTYYLIYGTYPFKHSDSNPIVDIKSIVRCEYDFPKNDDAPEEAKDLIRKMLVISQDERISVEDALNHSWFNDIREKCSQQNIQSSN